jgi:hypothetical protein
VADDGQRLSKRDHGVPIADQRSAGRDPAMLVRRIAAAYGQRVGDASDPWSALAEIYDPRSLPVEPVRVGQLLA